MKKALFILFMAVLAIACHPTDTREPRPNPGPEKTPVINLSAKVTSVKLHEAVVDVDVPGGSTYFIRLYKADEFGSRTAESTVAELKDAVAAGAYWADNIEIDPKPFTFTGLESDTDYKVLVFGMIDKGVITSREVVLDFHTLDYTMGLKVEDLTPFSFTVNVTTSRPELSWWGVLYNAGILENADFEQNVIADFHSGSDDIADHHGEGDEMLDYSGYVYPGDRFVFALLGLGEDGEPEIPLQYIEINVPETGVNYVAKETDGTIMTGVFTQGDDIFGVHVGAESDKAEYYIYLYDYNDGLYFGYDLASWSVDRADSFLLGMAEYEYQTAQKYADKGASTKEIADQAFRSFKNDPEIWDIWTRSSFEAIMKEPLKSAHVIAACINVDKDGKLSIVNGHSVKVSHKF